jgi:glycosyltransferase involved in cell wall biosynthesis
MQPEMAFVMDALLVIGGAEKVLLAALELFPGTPVYTLLYNPAPFARTILANSPVTTSFINRLPLAQKHHRSYLPVMPYAIQQFDLSRYERIVSFSYAVAHGVQTGPGQVHLSYTHTPMRYAWRNVPLRGALSGSRWLAGWILAAFRKWDAAAVRRVDQFGAISYFVSDLIRQAYQREARVIYPPVEVERFKPLLPRGRYYVSVSRLVAHKRIDLIVQAFSALKLPLVVVGEGPEETRLRKMAGPNITFAGFQDDAAVAALLGRARGFVHACEEDFGIAIVEAQAAGCPVIAYRQGAAQETVVEGKTGLFFCEQSSAGLIEAVERFERQAGAYCPGELAEHARRFNPARFRREFTDFVCQADPLKPDSGASAAVWSPPEPVPLWLPDRAGRT